MTSDDPHEIRVKRLAMRSMRRGIKEMDLILSAFARANLAGMSDAELDDYEALLEENDHDIYGWISGTIAVPAARRAMIARIADLAEGVARPV